MWGRIGVAGIVSLVAYLISDYVVGEVLSSVTSSVHITGLAGVLVQFIPFVLSIGSFIATVSKFT